MDRLAMGGLVVGVTLGLAAGLTGYTFSYASGASYLTNDPAACANCHVMAEYYDGWIRSSHRSVATCNDCHTPQALIPALIELIADLEGAQKGDAADLSKARDFQRRAQFYLDFVEAENSSGFHAPEEAQRVLAESVNFVRKGQLALRDLKGRRDSLSP